MTVRTPSMRVSPPTCSGFWGNCVPMPTLPAAVMVMAVVPLWKVNDPPGEPKGEVLELELMNQDVPPASACASSTIDAAPSPAAERDSSVP